MTKIVGRYAVCDEIAAGGMATLHLGRLLGPIGFSRTVAIKRLHPQYARDPAFVASMLDEARLVSRVKHLNVVPILDVISTGAELLLVMDYVHGESLSTLLRKARTRPPVPIMLAVVAGALHGLHAAHVARDEQGMPLGLVHRDVSPQNIMVGTDGLSRILDFGIAKAHGRTQTTEDGQLKGKLGYMAPEQFSSTEIDQRVDVYAAAVVLWESLTGRRLLDAQSPALMMNQILSREHSAPGALIDGIPQELDAIVLRGLARHRDQRFSTAREMAIALESLMPMPPPRVVGDWVESVASESLAEKAELVAQVEAESASLWSDTDGRVRIDEDALPTQVDLGIRSAKVPAVNGAQDSGQAATRPDQGDVTVSGIHTGMSDIETATLPLPVKKPAGSSRARRALPLAAAIGSMLLVALAIARVALRPDPSLPATSAANIPPSSAHAMTSETAPDSDTAPSLASFASASASSIGSTWPSSNTRSTPPPRPVATSDSCKPPYVVDSDGIRHPKLHCLGRR